MKKSTLFAVSACISMAGLAAVAATVTKNLAITVTSTGGGGQLPAGVTLSPIDGETLTGANNLAATTNTHSYYASHGFTNAASSTFNSAYNNGGWDDPRFFPIGDDYVWNYATTSTMQSLNLNLSFRVLDSADMTALRAAGLYAAPERVGPSNMGAESMGWSLDEPNDWATISSFLSSDGVNKVQHVNFTWNQFVFGPPSGTPGGTMNAAMSNLVAATGGNTHIHTSSADIYWFAGAALGPNCRGGSPPWAGFYLYSGTSGTNCTPGVIQMTKDQAARGDHYGDMVDMERAWLASVPGTNAAVQPVAGPYIEICDGFVNNGNSPVVKIKPPEFNWAVWNTIVHGSRKLLYFGATPLDDQCTFPAAAGFDTAIQPGQSVSIFTQAASTNGEILDLARIINSPFALGYASVTPVGYVFPTQHLSLTNGIDLMVKWYTGGAYSNSSGTFGAGFYIFATMRGSESQSSVSATFTLNGTAGETIPVVGEGRNVVMSGNSFTDTFGYPNAVVHIYGPISYP